MSSAGVLTQLDLQTARYRLGLATGPDLVLAAEESVLAGAASDAMILLAGEVDPIMSDAAPLFERALIDLGIEVPEPGQACWVVLRHHIARIAEQVVSPRVGCQAILDEVYHPGDLHEQVEEYAGDSHGIHEMLGYFYGIDDILERPHEVSCDGEFGSSAIRAVEIHIRDLAVKWLKQHGP